jgi:hypothetical protein
MELYNMVIYMWYNSIDNRPRRRTYIIFARHALVM